MRAVKSATDYVLAEPEKAWDDYVDFKPAMGTALNRKIFERSFAYFSKDLKNVERDWVRPKLVTPLNIPLTQICPIDQSHQVRETAGRARREFRSKLHKLFPVLDTRTRVPYSDWGPEEDG